MPVFDAHTHLGESLVSGKVISEDDLLMACKQHGVDGALVFPFPIAGDYRQAHDLVADFCARHPGFVGGACLNPLVGEETYVAEVERCVRDLGFVANKFHPMCHSMSPLYEAARIVFVTASSLGVPVVVHTGRGVPFALPSLCIPRAIEFPNLPIVLAHSGFGMYSAEAIVAAQVCPNIYLETSWCSASDIVKMVREVGSDRMMVGSDGPENLAVELAKYKTFRLSPAEREQCLSTTARTLFAPKLQWQKMSKKEVANCEDRSRYL